MKNKLFSIAYILTLAVSLAFTFMPTDHYEVTSGFTIGFKSADPSGNFKTLTGSVDYDSKDISNTKLSLKVAVSSINTGNGLRDKKAQIEEWFDAKKYPNITFSSTKVEKSSTGINITGNLTMKGVVKKMTIPATIEESGNKITLKGSFKVNRMDFGVGKKSDVVPDFMNISFVVPAIKK